MVISFLGLPESGFSSLYAAISPHGGSKTKVLHTFSAQARSKPELFKATIAIYINLATSKPQNCSNSISNLQTQPLQYLGSSKTLLLCNKTQTPSLIFKTYLQSGLDCIAAVAAKQPESAAMLRIDHGVLNPLSEETPNIQKRSFSVGTSSLRLFRKS